MLLYVRGVRPTLFGPPAPEDSSVGSIGCSQHEALMLFGLNLEQVSPEGASHPMLQPWLNQRTEPLGKRPGYPVGQREEHIVRSLEIFHGALH